MKIEEGCIGVMRSGIHTGVIRRVKRDDTLYPWVDSKYTWTERGRLFVGRESHEDIIAVYHPEEPAQSVTIASSVRKIYLSGPMQGLPDRNYPLFHKVAKALRDLGFEVYNPAEYPAQGTDDFPLREAFMDYCRFILTEADTVVVLPNWENSKGVRVEKTLAEIIGLKVVYL